jgi:hypothetical protein
MKTPRRLACAALAALTALTALFSTATVLPAASAQETVIALDYNSHGWRYLQVAPDTDVPAFQNPNFDDSAWPTGQAAFGTPTGCAFNSSVKTRWQTHTHILLRHWVQLPRGAQNVRIEGTVDNDAQVYLNGQHLQSAQGGDCRANTINVTVPSDVLQCCNLLAIHGSDTGVSSFLDVRVTYTPPAQA